MKACKAMQELLEQVKGAKSVAGVLRQAEAHGCKLAQHEAEAVFAAMQKRSALSEDELDMVAGGIDADVRKPSKPDIDISNTTNKFI